MDFNFFDVFIIIITIILSIKGWITGIIKELAGLFGIIVGLYFGSIYYQEMGKYIDSSIFKIPNESAINVVGFVAVFFIIWFFILGVGFIFAKAIHLANLGFLDRIGGLLFSAGKFFIIMSVIVTMLSQIEAIKSNLEKYQKNSIIWPIMNEIGKNLINLKPEDLNNQMNRVKEKISTHIKTITERNQ